MKAVFTNAITSRYDCEAARYKRTVVDETIPWWWTRAGWEQMPAEIFSDVTRSSRDWTLVQVSSADLARTPSGIGDTENHLHDLLSTTSNETLLTTCNRRPWCLELTARTFATNYFNRTFQALSKNVFIPADIALSALETFLYKFTHLPTYLLTYLLIKGGAARRPTSLAFMITTFVQLRRSTLHATITTVI